MSLSWERLQGTWDLRKEDWLKVIETTVPPKTVEINKKAFETGLCAFCLDGQKPVKQKPVGQMPGSKPRVDCKQIRGYKDMSCKVWRVTGK